MINHSVLMITYNQESFIKEAIESVISQREFLFEIIIVDDKSSDSTFDIILEYQKAYPKLIKAYQNEINIGVYKNYEKVKSLSNGNVISFCSGDDKLGLNCIKNVNQEYKRLKINPSSERAIIITNSAHLYPNGRLTHWNNFIERDKTLFRSSLRQSLSHRGVGYSIALLNSLPKMNNLLLKSNGLGWGYDSLKGLYEAKNIDRYSHINILGGIYRLDSGVTSIKKDKEYWDKYINTQKAIKSLFKTQLSKSDLKYINFIIKGCKFKKKASIKNWFIALYYLIINTNNFGYNNPFIRNIHFLLSDRITIKLKKTYYYYLKLLK